MFRAYLFALLAHVFFRVQANLSQASIDNIIYALRLDHWNAWNFVENELHHNKLLCNAAHSQTGETILNQAIRHRKHHLIDIILEQGVLLSSDDLKTALRWLKDGDQITKLHRHYYKQRSNAPIRRSHGDMMTSNYQDSLNPIHSQHEDNFLTKSSDDHDKAFSLDSENEWRKFLSFEPLTDFEEEGQAFSSSISISNTTVVNDADSKIFSPFLEKKMAINATVLADSAMFLDLGDDALRELVKRTSNDDRITALNNVIGLNHTVAAKKLLRTIDPDISRSRSICYADNPIFRAIQIGNVEILKAIPKDFYYIFVLKTSNNVSLLVIAAEVGSVNIVRYLIEQGEHPNQTMRGLTPLGAAVVNDQIEVAKFLISAGVDVNYIFNAGRSTALSISLRHKKKRRCFEMIVLLILAGSDLEMERNQKAQEDPLVYGIGKANIKETLKRAREIQSVAQVYYKKSASTIGIDFHTFHKGVLKLQTVENFIRRGLARGIKRCVLDIEVFSQKSKTLFEHEKTKSEESDFSSFNGFESVQNPTRVFGQSVNGDTTPRSRKRKTPPLS